LHPASIENGMVDFLQKQFHKNKGGTALKFRIRDAEKNYDVELNGAKSIQITDDLAAFLLSNKNIQIKVVMMNGD
jgi:hypothetical protein